MNAGKISFVLLRERQAQFLVEIDMQVREENSKLLLTSLETLTPQHETWKIQEKDLLLNRAGNCLNIT